MRISEYIDEVGMKDWHKHWTSFPASFEPGEYLRQVGKVWHGEPIAEAQVRALVGDIQNKLGLTAESVLLDLCCGNGLLTHQLAAQCSKTVGVDFSEPLIDVARRAHPLSSGRYVHASILDLDRLAIGGPFTHILCYEALQHFAEWQLGALLDAILYQATDDPTILLGSIPDERQKWNFYCTPEYRADYLRRLELGEEAIGTWWSSVLIEDACRRRGLVVEILEQPPILHTAHYRFDCRIRRQ